MLIVKKKVEINSIQFHYRTHNRLENLKSDTNTFIIQFEFFKSHQGFIDYSGQLDLAAWEPRLGLIRFMFDIFPGDICIWLDSVRSILSCPIISIFLAGNWKVNIVFRGFNELFQLFIFIWDSKIQRGILFDCFKIPSLGEDFRLRHF